MKPYKPTIKFDFRQQVYCAKSGNKIGTIDTIYFRDGRYKYGVKGRMDVFDESRLTTTPKRPCKHHELMKRYAMDAAQREDPWTLWEYRYKSDWASCTHHPAWNPYVDYRRVGE